MRLAILLLTALASAGTAHAYAVLTHEALIDTLWVKSIEPVLLKRFPGSTPEQLKVAHAYCYGGAIIQDMGYYPFGSHLFSDLTHYVRSGDFVMSLLGQAADLNEFAFAIGALSHYNADNEGHPAINATVPELYPKLRRRYGNIVTYQENRSAHVRTEFGFDVLQVARSLYPSQTYHDFIGFEAAKPLLDRACLQTYGLKLSDIIASPDLAVSTYRFSIKSIIPAATKAAWSAKKDTILQKAPKTDRRQFVYNLSRSSYRKEWGRTHQRSSCLQHLLTLLIKILPKIGPLKILAFRIPSAAAELRFEKAFDVTVAQDRADLESLAANTLSLRNRDLDTGNPSHQGEYELADTTYTSVFKKLAEEKLAVPAALQADYSRFKNTR